MIKGFLYTAASQVLFWMGDIVNDLLDEVTEDWPHLPMWSYYWIYCLYTLLMEWSCRLDIHHKVWLHRRDGETEEAFEARVKAQYPDDRGWDA